jgi:hypothetical protein
MRTAPLARDTGVTVRFRRFLLGPLFKAQDWDTSPFNLYPAKGRNMWHGLGRLCSNLDLPFRRPNRFRRIACSPRAFSLLNATSGEEFCACRRTGDLATDRIYGKHQRLYSGGAGPP